MTPVTVHLTLTELAALTVLCGDSDTPAYRTLGAKLGDRLHDEQVKRIARERYQDAIQRATR